MVDESVPDNPVVITACIGLERSKDVVWLKEVVLPRILRHPRFSSVVVAGKEGKMRFKYVPGFTADNEKLISHHVHVEHLGGSNKSGKERERIFQERLSEIMSTPLDSTRPLWKISLFPHWSIAGKQGLKGDGCMVVIRVHHSISDGMGLMKYFSSEIIDNVSEEDQTRLLVVPERQQRPTLDNIQSSKKGEDMSSLSPSAASKSLVRAHVNRRGIPRPGLLRQAWEFVEDIYFSSVRMLFADPISAFTKSTIQREKVCALMPPSESTVGTLKEASRALGVTLNDLLYTAVAGASRLYLREFGDNPDELKDLRCAIPFNEHALDSFSLSDVSNVFAVIPLQLHVHEENRKKRLEECVQTLRRAKRSHQPAMLMGLLQLVARMPQSPRRLLWRKLTRSTSILFTNVPGPKETVYIGGVKVSSVYFFAPADGHAGVVVGMFSYVNKIALGVAGDKGRISNPQRFVELLSAEIDLLVELSR